MPDPENLDRARRAVAAVGINAEGLTDLLRESYGEAYVAGTHAAMGALPASVEAIGPTWEADIDWSTWEPGAARTAAELAGTDGGRGLATLLDDADVVIQGVSDFTLDVLARELAAGVEAGESTAQLTARLRGALDDPRRAEVIARTESARAQTVATLDVYRENGMGGRQWLAASDAEEDCAALDGTVAAMDDDFPDGDPPLHPACLVASTLVVPGDVAARLTSHPTPGRIGLGSDLRPIAATTLAESPWDIIRRNLRAATVREYIGEVVTIELATGQVLTGTPNHPIATPLGWVPLSELHVGDDVLRSLRPEWVMEAIDPDEDHVPPSIEQVAKSLPVALRSVPTTAEDFHGDGAGSDVCVVLSDGLLKDDSADASGPEHGHQGSLGVADVLGQTPLPGLRSLDQLGLRRLAAANRGVGGGSQAHPLISRGGRHPKTHGVTTAASRQSPIQEEPAHRSPADSEGFCQSLLALPGEVAASNVVRVGREPFRGHVYNLDTAEGWYIGNGIVTHNCRCTITPVLASEMP